MGGYGVVWLLLGEVALGCLQVVLKGCFASCLATVPHSQGRVLLGAIVFWKPSLRT